MSVDLREPAELVAAIEQKIDQRLGASPTYEPRERTVYRLECTPAEMQSLTDVLMSERRGPHEQWKLDVRRLLLDRFGFVPTVQVQVTPAIPSNDGADQGVS